MAFRLRIALLCAAVLSVGVCADEVVYAGNALSSTWQDWSWGSTINYAATDVTDSGTSSISINSSAYSALSLYDTSVFSSFAGLKFDVAVGATSSCAFIKILTC